MSIFKNPKYAVIGAGCGGQALAGYLAMQNFDVALYNRSYGRIAPIMEKNYIELTSVLKGRGKMSNISTEISTVLKDRDIVMIVTTATGHREIGKKIAPYLKDGQIILLNPGRTFGAVEVEHAIRESGCLSDIIVAEANTLLFTTRIKTPGVTIIKGIKKEVTVAALRKSDTDYALEQLRPAFPQFKAAGTILETSFSNIGALFHPVITLFNRDKIYNKEGFDFYIDGVTQEVADYIEKVDNEVQQVAKALGTIPLSVKKWLHSRYGINYSDLFTMIRSNSVYKGIKSADTLNHRYLWEDIPTGLVPVSTFGKALNVDTSAIDGLIDRGCEMLDTNFWDTGRTPEKLGFCPQNLKKSLYEMINNERVKAA